MPAPASANVDGGKGRSVLGWLVKIEAAAAREGAGKLSLQVWESAALSQLLSLACASSEACALHVSQERKWRAQLGAIMPKASPHAEKERRRERARAGRARLMASMQQKQQRSREEAPDEAAEGRPLTPGSARAPSGARRRRRRCTSCLDPTRQLRAVQGGSTRATPTAPRCACLRARAGAAPRAGGASRRLAHSRGPADDGGLCRGRWRRRWKGPMPTLMGRPPATGMGVGVPSRAEGG